jgi:hypothetical protein
MAARSRSTGGNSDQPQLARPKQETSELIAERIEAGNELITWDIPVSESMADSLEHDFTAWREFNVRLLRRAFTTSELADDYADRPGVIYMGPVGPNEEIEYTRKFTLASALSEGQYTSGDCGHLGVAAIPYSEVRVSLGD